MDKCKGCALPIEYIVGTYRWTVMGSGTTADGLTYCPPNPDGDGPFGHHEPEPGHLHSWVAGMMVVHPEDLDAVAKARGADGIECECGVTLLVALASGWSPYGE